MQLEQPFQKNCLVRLMHQSFGMLKRDKITFRLGLKQPCVQRTVCRDNENADIMTTGLKSKNFLITNITMLCYLHNRNAFLLLIEFLPYLFS